MKNELCKQGASSGPQTVKLPPKTEAELLMEKQQEQDEKFKKQAEGDVQKRLKEGNVELL